MIWGVHFRLGWWELQVSITNAPLWLRFDLWAPPWGESGTPRAAKGMPGGVPRRNLGDPRAPTRSQVERQWTPKGEAKEAEDRLWDPRGENREPSDSHKENLIVKRCKSSEITVLSTAFFITRVIA